MMTIVNKEILSEWPKDELERPECCPYCGSTNFKTAFTCVLDWSFHTAPGAWSYVECASCAALYLWERPVESSIHRAYQTYYTHEDETTRLEKKSVYFRLKNRVNNECLSIEFGISLQPRLSIPRGLRWILNPIIKYSAKPYPIKELAQLQAGRMLDVGCGSGETVQLARSFGWKASGIDIDPVAVEVAQRNGLDVQLASYEKLKEYDNIFDCIVCAHVLEHVYEPDDLLRSIKKALKRNGGVLLLTLPNSASALRHFFGERWRGLEAPRHLSIPSERGLIEKLEKMGFDVVSDSDKSLATGAESFRLQRDGLKLSDDDVKKSEQLERTLEIPEGCSDFIKLRCRSFGL